MMCEELTRERGLGLGVVNGEVTRKIRVSEQGLFVQILVPQFPICGGVFFPPGTGRASFTWEFCYLFQGRKARG